jgi:nucleotide-binding universal stress UspA family protein
VRAQEGIAVSSSIQIRTVLVFADGSEGAVRTMDVAMLVARAHQADLVAVALVDTETLSMLLRQHILVREEMVEFSAQLAAGAKRLLHAVAGQAEREGVRAETVLLEGNIHTTVLAEARRRKADLIVLSGFTSTITRRDVLAKEKQYLVDGAPCSVLLVK